MPYLELGANRLTSFSFLIGLPALTVLNLDRNGLTDFTLPSDLNGLTALRLSGNPLTKISLPPGQSLASLDLTDTQLNDFLFLEGQSGFTWLYLTGSRLTSLALPAGLTSLRGLFLQNNQLTNLVLPTGMLNLTDLYVAENPLSQLVLPEPLALGSLVNEVALLRQQGVSVLTYPLQVILTVLNQNPLGMLTFAASGPPGIYRVQRSGDLVNWQELGSVTNQFDKATVTQPIAALEKSAFYRVSAR